MVANMEGKSVLRAVVAQVAREYSSNVIYFPAYEIVMAGGRGSFEADGRHVKGEVVQSIMNAFSQGYVSAL